MTTKILGEPGPWPRMATLPDTGASLPQPRVPLPARWVQITHQHLAAEYDDRAATRGTQPRDGHVFVPRVGDPQR